MLKYFCLFLISLLFYIQYLVWFGESGYFEQKTMNRDFKKIEDKLIVMQEKNRILSNQIRELKSNPKSIESEARLKLGMIKPGEFFFMVPEKTSLSQEEY